MHVNLTKKQSAAIISSMKNLFVNLSKSSVWTRESVHSKSRISSTWVMVMKTVHPITLSFTRRFIASTVMMSLLGDTILIGILQFRFVSPHWCTWHTLFYFSGTRILITMSGTRVCILFLITQWDTEFQLRNTSIIKMKYFRMMCIKMWTMDLQITWKQTLKSCFLKKNTLWMIKQKERLRLWTFTSSSKTEK